MGKDNFTEEDYKKAAEFLNFIAQKAEFNGWSTEDTITHFKLLAHMQQQIMPKIQKNILEITKVVEAENSSEETTETKE